MLTIRIADIEQNDPLNIGENLILGLSFLNTQVCA
jgi:hypothetical protein